MVIIISFRISIMTYEHCTGDTFIGGLIVYLNNPYVHNLLQLLIIYICLHFKNVCGSINHGIIIIFMSFYVFLSRCTQISSQSVPTPLSLFRVFTCQQKLSLSCAFRELCFLLSLFHYGMCVSLVGLYCLQQIVLFLLSSMPKSAKSV